MFGNITGGGTISSKYDDLIPWIKLANALDKSTHRTVIVEYDKKELEDMIRSSKSAGCSLTSYLTAMWIRDISSKADVGYAVDGEQHHRVDQGNEQVDCR